MATFAVRVDVEEGENDRERPGGAGECDERLRARAGERKREPDRRRERRQDDQRVEDDVEMLRGELGQMLRPGAVRDQESQQPGEGDPPPRTQ